MTLVESRAAVEEAAKKYADAKVRGFKPALLEVGWELLGLQLDELVRAAQADGRIRGIREEATRMAALGITCEELVDAQERPSRFWAAVGIGMLCLAAAGFVAWVVLW